MPPTTPEPPTTPSGGRLGILGGTFDPPHLAHLVIAEEAREALGLERVLFVPAGRPWQKAARAVTPGPVRRAMVARAIAGNPAFAVDGREIDRPGPSYTVDTLAELAAGGAGAGTSGSSSPRRRWRASPRGASRSGSWSSPGCASCPAGQRRRLP